MCATRVPRTKLPAAATTASAWTRCCGPTNFLSAGFTEVMGDKGWDRRNGRKVFAAELKENAVAAQRGSCCAIPSCTTGASAPAKSLDFYQAGMKVYSLFGG